MKNSIFDFGGDVFDFKLKILVAMYILYVSIMQTELNKLKFNFIIDFNSCLCSSVAELKSFNLKAVSSSLLVGMLMIF